MIRQLIAIFFLFFLVIVVKSSCPKKCDPDSCETPGTCLAGMVKDVCNCCYVCGVVEGQRCYSTQVPGHRNYSKCGNHMKCKVRNDLAPGDTPEAICYCVNDEPICGSDGVTYRNLCHLSEVRYQRRDGLIAVSHGPCKYAPIIISPPTDVRNKTGSFVAFSCEVSGWPVPNIEWRFVANDSKKSEIMLPADDPHMAVQSRGGPNSYEITSWLQILQVKPSNEGIYTCVASNELGEDSGTASLTLTDNEV
ncbi:Kazal-type serine protease inhibitor domain-containing protein 1-like protein [Dinothrombium tinctorium]|uniref:Kazal-type serine protease inhibitor domain-containing protein 1-like protein n=1 Tax=Dinothrombium tinctorium TaxID=1965070 RepID=A0A3S3PM02_9ACAR|nr:Kazal-type serine protease inhibitor domain-containing protein 1-like protein [Dinothrombium tinctorium]